MCNNDQSAFMILQLQYAATKDYSYISNALSC